MDGANEGAFRHPPSPAERAARPYLAPLSIHFRRSGEAQRPPDLRNVTLAAGQVVKCSLGDTDDVVANKGCAFARAVLGVF
jgi:hypothetical protein